MAYNREIIYLAALYSVMMMFTSVPSPAQTTEAAPKMHVDGNKVILGGPVNERLFLHKFHNDSSACGEEEINIKISNGKVTYNMNESKNTKIRWKKDGSQIVVGNEGCEIRVFINRPPVSTRCEHEKCG